MAGAPIILCLNAGSSSLKFSVWDGDDCLGDGEVEEIGRPGAFAWLRLPDRPARRLPGRWADHARAVGDNPRHLCRDRWQCTQLTCRGA